VGLSVKRIGPGDDFAELEIGEPVWILERDPAVNSVRVGEEFPIIGRRLGVILRVPNPLSSDPQNEEWPKAAYSLEDPKTVSIGAWVERLGLLDRLAWEASDLPDRVRSFEVRLAEPEKWPPKAIP
jgi:hypothetical protein